jgi:hypothetical protein
MITWQDKNKNSNFDPINKQFKYPCYENNNVHQLNLTSLMENNKVYHFRPILDQQIQQTNPLDNHCNVRVARNITYIEISL